MNDASNQYLIVLGLDIEGYSKKPVQAQMRAQKKLEEWVVASSEAAGLYHDTSMINWIDAGDGGYLLFETEYVKAVNFLDNFYREVVDHNSTSNPDASINVRSAVHCEDAIRWSGKLGTKYAGNALIVCARILDSMNRNYSNQTVCSGVFLRKVSATGMRVEPLRMPDQIDKHGFAHEVWNIMKSPGFGVRPDEADLHEQPAEWHLQGQ